MNLNVGVRVSKRCGFLKSVTVPETVGKVHEMLIMGRPLKTHEISENVNISKERATYILTTVFAKKKLPIG